MSTYKKVIIFGATGAIGVHLTKVIAKEQPTWDVFAVTRNSTSDKFKDLPKVKVVQGDAEDRDTVMNLTADKDIVYSCVGFSHYEAKYWAKHWPVVVDNLLAASSQKQGQKLVFCDNLYAYGPGQNISPNSPTIEPSTKTKPAIRVLLRQKFQKRMTEDPSSITVVGGADFFGPLVTSTSFLGDTFTKAIVEGKTAPLCLGSASVVHDFAYAPDFSNALYIASIKPEAYGKFWICPHTVHGKNLNEIAVDIGRIAASENTKVTVLKGWLVTLLSPFVGFFSEMREMLGFWNQDYTVDDSDFCETFSIKATPYEEALKEYIDFYKSLAK